jgi:NAD(P)-dependent dehydrogenase (short-subunit alcohol dehydrogenase family)
VFKPRNILVTGGSRGLGLGFVRRLVQRGHNVALTDISDKAALVYSESTGLKSVIEELLPAPNRESDVKCIFKPADLTDNVEADGLINWAWSELGYIDVIIANAGGDIVGEDADASGGKPLVNNSQICSKSHLQVFNRNYLTCWNVVTKIAPMMRDRSFGKIITISSVNASVGMPTETAYSAAKAAVIQLTRSLAVEYREAGVSANCLMLGPTNTGRFRATLKGRSAHDLRAFDSKGRLTRIAEIDDACNVMEFLVEEKSDYISGQVIRVDGGLFSQPV